MKKAPIVTMFLLAAQPVFAQEVATSTPAPATSDLSKFISLPEGSNSQWIIHGKGEIAISCIRGKKTADGKLGIPWFSIKSGARVGITTPGIDLETTPQMFNLPKSLALPATMKLSLSAKDYCNPNGTVKIEGNPGQKPGQKLIKDVITQIAEQLNITKPTLIRFLAAPMH